MSAPFLSKPVFCGIDVASETLVASLIRTPEKRLAGPAEFDNDPAGFAVLVDWLREHEARTEDTLVCMEATGVYAEALCYYLHEAGYRVAVEDPLKVKRAFKTTANKTDPVDSRQIAEYAARFYDALRLWQPHEAVIEQMRILLAMREQLVREAGAKRNALHVLERKVVKTPLATRLVERTLEHLKAQIAEIDDEVRRLIRSHPTLAQAVTLLVSIPGVGLQLAAHLAVITGGFERRVTARQLAAYAGICPFEHRSGTSVYRAARSRRYGPPVLRKLLYLAALTNRRHTPRFRHYYERKRAEGKAARLALNNVSNKLLRVICAVLREGVPYHENHRSPNPTLTLTA
jgi:transposase